MPDDAKTGQTPAAGECVICDRVWAVAAIVAAGAVAFIAFDMFSGGKLTAWLGEHIGPRFAGLRVIQGGEGDGDGDDTDAA